MPDAFYRTGSGRTVIRLDDVEKGLLRSLSAQVIEFVAPDDAGDARDPLAIMIGIDDEATAPVDPALARLLPDAYQDDDDAAMDFRRFTERSLRETKAAHARTVGEVLERSGEKVTLSDQEQASWLGFLNDGRLAIGTRIGLTDDNHAEIAALPDEDPRAGLLDFYDWLTYLQESLVQLHLDDLS